MENRYLYIYLASGVINDVGFWTFGINNCDTNILDDKNLLECHRKELIGLDSGKEIIDAINLNLENLINDLKKQNIKLDSPPKGVSYNFPLILLENIFDFWIEKYKDKDLWETCIGLLKIRSKVSLKHLINSDSIKGDSKKWAIKIEELHNYKPSSIKNKTLNDPMWK